MYAISESYTYDLQMSGTQNNFDKTDDYNNMCFLCNHRCSYTWTPIYVYKYSYF